MARTTHAPRTPCTAGIQHSAAASLRRCRALGTAIVAGLLVALALLLMAPLDALANYYERGNWLCDDFADMEQVYRAEPDDINLNIGYAGCLIVRNQGDDETRGLAILHNIVENRTERERVKAAWMIASYLSSGGTFEDTIDENTINEAIEAYKRVVFFIDLDTNYPRGGNELYEEEAQIEVVSHYRLPVLYFAKFKHGAKGTDNSYLLTSPSHYGDSDLNTYPDYAPYTIDSLEQTIMFADQCLGLPKKRYFKQRVFEAHLAGCGVLKDAATELLPLERQRLVLLGMRSCSDDLPKCPEYYELKDEMVSTIKRAHSGLREIFETL